MKLSQNGLNFIKKWEGLILEAYRDMVGVPTIGYGHTQGVKEGDKITPEQAEKLLKDDVKHFEFGVSKLINELGIRVTQNQFDALVSLAFNVGLGNLKRSTLIKKLYLMTSQDSESIESVANEFLRWNKAGGKVVKGLTNRRTEEREMFLKKD